jgi:hypothetical protein
VFQAPLNVKLCNENEQAPHREEADGILDSVKTGSVATQRLAVTGPSGVEIELAVPQGATQQQVTYTNH